MRADGMMVGPGHKMFVGTGPVELSWVPACGSLPGHVLAQSNMGLIVKEGPCLNGSAAGKSLQCCVYQVFVRWMQDAFLHF